MAHFDLFAAQAMIYFATVSFAEARQRLLVRDPDAAAWSGFVGVGDSVLAPLPGESLQRLLRITRGNHTAVERRKFAEWVRDAIASRNIGGFGEPSRRHLYPVDLDWLIERHDLLGMTRDQVIASLPALRGRSPEPAFA
jgi:hypothetical protein